MAFGEEMRFPRSKGYALHLFTASGAAFGALALQAVISDDIRSALLWLLASQVVDGLDGPLARRLNVSIHAPRIDGHTLDLVIDYLTCVVVPIAFLFHFEMLPESLETLIAGFICIFSALWFARPDLETPEHWFQGFPAAWNLAVPTMFIFELSRVENAVICIILSVSQLTSLKVPHIVRAKWLRKITFPFGVIYLANLILVSYSYSEINGISLSAPSFIILIGFPLYISIIMVLRTFYKKENFKPVT